MAEVAIGDGDSSAAGPRKQNVRKALTASARENRPDEHHEWDPTTRTYYAYGSPACIRGELPSYPPANTGHSSLTANASSTIGPVIAVDLVTARCTTESFHVARNDESRLPPCRIALAEFDETEARNPDVAPGPLLQRDSARLGRLRNRCGPHDRRHRPWSPCGDHAPRTFHPTGLAYRDDFPAPSRRRVRPPAGEPRSPPFLPLRRHGDVRPPAYASSVWKIPRSLRSPPPFAKGGVSEMG